jgi:hypothetical protein
MRFLMIFMLLLLCAKVGAQSMAQPACDPSDDAMLGYQDEILRSVEKKPADDKAWLKDVSYPLTCLLQNQNQNQGLEKYFAGSFLRPLLGADQIEGLPKDKRFKKVSEILSHMTLAAENSSQSSVLAEFAQGEWGFYSPCDRKKNKKCPIFLPEEKDIRDDAPLIAAASMLHLQKAYLALDGKEKREVEKRIKSLYKTIPKTSRLKRKVINEIYAELFAAKIRMSLS